MLRDYINFYTINLNCKKLIRYDMTTETAGEMSDAAIGLFD